MARPTLSGGQNVTGPGAAPGAAMLVPWPGKLRICWPAPFDTLTDPFDEEYAERLTVNRPAPEFRPADADDRNRGRHADLRARQFRHLARHKAERAKETKFDRSAAGGGVIYVIIERQLRLLAERQ